MIHGESILDIDKMSSFPTTGELIEIGKNAQEAASPYSFERLGRLLS
jgi:hypothetical protein